MDVILILLICEPVLCLQNSHKQNIKSEGSYSAASEVSKELINKLETQQKICKVHCTGKTKRHTLDTCNYSPQQ